MEKFSLGLLVGLVSMQACSSQKPEAPTALERQLELCKIDNQNLLSQLTDCKATQLDISSYRALPYFSFETAPTPTPGFQGSSFKTKHIK